MKNTASRKPCLALMGEFSAGKSTLANLLIGSDPLPVQVVATQLPPVRISHGDDPAYAVDLDGQKHDVDLHSLGEFDLDQIAYLQIFCTEDILLQCDLLDMPGISDPNMSSDVWERMIDDADGVLWCSHATQAWRQSEAAVWAEMPESLRQHSLLLLTRIDKLQTESDRARVLNRVKRETAGLFAGVLPISLLLATQEQSDYAVWQQSGAEEFAAQLIQLLAGLNGAAPDAETDLPADALRLPGLEVPAGLKPEVAQPEMPAVPRVLPRRIRQDGPKSPRPPAE